MRRHVGLAEPVWILVAALGRYLVYGPDRT
jgi:hypothetical protein